MLFQNRAKANSAVFQNLNQRNPQILHTTEVITNKSHTPKSDTSPIQNRNFESFSKLIKFAETPETETTTSSDRPHQTTMPSFKTLSLTIQSKHQDLRRAFEAPLI